MEELNLKDFDKEEYIRSSIPKKVPTSNIEWDTYQGTYRLFGLILGIVDCINNYRCFISIVLF